MSKLAPMALVVTAWLLCAAAEGATYYVSPKGDDAQEGTSADTAWKTCKKVAGVALQPGDTVLFERGGEWRERLSATANGAEGKPITYDAYGEGAKPRFYGSELLENAKFKALWNDSYAYPLDAKAETALQDHVFIPSAWIDGVLLLTVKGSNPLTDGKVYTACVRGNVIYSDHRNHIVFRNLVADETAGQISDGSVAGYGIRIEGSIDVLVENCEAYRCGRHHIAAINSTGFIGRHLHAEYTQPKTPGGNSFYCTYSDQNAPVDKCTSVWEDLTADHMENGDPGHGEGVNNFFAGHDMKGRQGSITMRNVVAQTKLFFGFDGTLVITGGLLKKRASIENFSPGALIDGVTLTDSSAIDQYGKDSIIQNCVAHLTPERGGPTGYSSAIVLRQSATGNIVRFNTLVTKSFHALALASNGLGTQLYGNILLADNSAVLKTPLDKSDLAFADYNFYGPGANIGENVGFEAWKEKGFDLHALTGDPKFVDAAKNNFALQAESPCLNGAKLAANQIPPADFVGVARQRDAGADIGAFARTAAPGQ